MEYRLLGKTGLQVSVLGFGGSEIGYEHTPLRTVDRLLNGALDAGVNIIDTAECYGTSEELIGQSIGHRRREYYLLTKCGHRDVAGFSLPDWDVLLMERSIERSLRRLRTDSLDVVQLHSCSEDVLRQGDVITALQRARAAGKVRYLGYSGDGQAAAYAIETRAFDALQISINLADQEALDEILPAARQHGLGVIAKRPLANAAWKYDTEPDGPYVRPYWMRLRALDYGVLRSNTEPAAGTALRFTLSVPGVHTAIVGTVKPGRLEQNLGLLETGLLPEPQYDAMRARWKAVAQEDWVGQR